MKTGIFYDNLRDSLNTDEDELLLLNKAKDAGAEYVECEWGFVKTRKDDFFIRLNKLGMGICAYAFVDTECIFRDKNPIENDFAAMKNRGIDRLLLVCGLDRPTCMSKAEAEERIVLSVNRVCAIAADYGIMLTFEDFGNMNIPCGKSTDMKRFAARIPGLSLTLDTGNFYCFGEELLSSYGILKGRIRHVHVKDHFTVAPDSLCCVLGEGALPIKEILHILKADGYDGWLSAEIFDVPATPENLYASVQFIKDNFR